MYTRPGLWLNRGNQVHVRDRTDHASWATLEMVAFDSTLEPFAFAGANHINLFTDSEQADSHLIAFFNLWIFDAKFAQETQWRQVVALQMPQLAHR